MDNTKKFASINHTYNSVICEAIEKSEKKILKVSQIYEYLELYYKIFLNKNWKNSVRHSLSLRDNRLFARTKLNNKGGYWCLIDNHHQELFNKKKKPTYISDEKKEKIKLAKKLDDLEIFNCKKTFLDAYLKDINFN
jgi:hypothetical protein